MKSASKTELNAVSVNFHELLYRELGGKDIFKKHVMIKLKLETSWDQMLQKVLEAEPQITAEEIDFRKGEDEELVRKLAQKLNRSYERTIGWVESLSSLEGNLS